MLTWWGEAGECKYQVDRYMKVYLPDNPKAPHPVPAQALPTYENCKGKATKVPSLENWYNVHVGFATYSVAKMF